MADSFIRVTLRDGQVVERPAPRAAPRGEA